MAGDCLLAAAGTVDNSNFPGQRPYDGTTATTKKESTWTLSISPFSILTRDMPRRHSNFRSSLRHFRCSALTAPSNRLNLYFSSLFSPYTDGKSFRFHGRLSIA